MLRLLALAFTALAAIAPTLSAQAAYPDKPIRLIVPFPPGGSTDTVARVIANKLTLSLGQPVTVENRSGANGNIGADMVARSAPDGYTMMIGGAANAINATFYRNLPFDLLKDFTPFAMIGVSPNMMVVPMSVPAKTPAEFVAWVKAQPKPVSYASSGLGASTHMTGELFKQVTGTNMVHVPYRGSAPALTDLIAGRTVVMFDNMTSSLQQVKAGTLRALALTSSQRSPAVPDLPTLKESGIDVEAETWFGLFVPSATPKPIVERLNKEVRKIIKLPDVQPTLVTFGIEQRDMDVAQLRKFTEADVKKWAKVIKISGAKAE